MVNPAMATVGFPASYPYATSMPMPSAILRPLQQPIYDTEVYVAAVAVTDVQYFQRQVGQTFAFGTTPAVKTLGETNLTQPGQLANPLEFSLFGFTHEIDPGVTYADYVLIYRTALFTFTYTGNRVYLQIPLTKIPQGVGPDGFSFANTAAVAQGGTVKQGVGHVSNVYKFTIGKAALRIRPTEAFNARVSYSKAVASGDTAAVTCTASTRCRVILHGLSWTAL